MPPSPEFLDAGSKIRAFKVDHQVFAKQFGTADGNVRISRKIAVDLNGIKHRSHQQRKSRIRLQIIINLVHIHRQRGGDDQLLEISPGHELQALRYPLIGKFCIFVQLGHKTARPGNRPGNELREKGHKQGIISQMPLCRDFFTINVDQVSQRLERIERNTDGHHQLQRHIRRRQSQQPRPAADRMGKEIKIFEEKQRPQAHYKRRGQPLFLLFLFVTFFHADGTDIRHCRCPQDPHHHPRAVVHIEEITGRQKNDPTPAFVDCIIQKKYDR